MITRHFFASVTVPEFSAKLLCGNPYPGSSEIHISESVLEQCRAVSLTKKQKRKFLREFQEFYEDSMIWHGKKNFCFFVAPLPKARFDGEGPWVDALRIGDSTTSDEGGDE